ncbi:hypothetical protein JX265_010278 [Neoarthrinium moseri]|uniref:Uncharacterized protein n=1 Tax=Neoarthrinium moseri TaxID=1658444 RepID=A0A9Q0AIM1_9PEZI|nr:hypothetical protein JX265_010278 [Neoarthrinium moseri]
MRFERFLVDFIPRSGLIYEDHQRVRLLGRNEHDACVLRALIGEGIIKTGKLTRAEITAAKHKVEGALCAVFAAGCAPEYRAFLHHWDVPNFEENLRRQATWTRALGENVFTQLIHAFVNARLAWNRRPQYPYDKSEHSALAKQIDIFLESVGDDWVAAEEFHHNCAYYGGFDDDDNLNAADSMAHSMNGSNSDGSDVDMENLDSILHCDV